MLDVNSTLDGLGAQHESWEIGALEVSEEALNDEVSPKRPMPEARLSDPQSNAVDLFRQKLAHYGLLSRSQERRLAEELERSSRDIVAVLMAKEKSRRQFCALVQQLIKLPLKKRMFVSDRYYFALRREVDDFTAAGQTKNSIVELVKTGLANSARKIALKDNQHAAQTEAAAVDWPSPFVVALVAIFTQEEKHDNLTQALLQFAETWCGIEREIFCCSEEQARQLKGLRTSFLRARDCMVQHNLRLVFHIARRYAQKAEHQLELIQEGSFGLIRAVEKYRLKSGYRFSTYAHHWIDSSIRKARINIDKLMPITNALNTELYQIYRAIEKDSVVGLASDLDGIAEKTGMKKNRIQYLMQLRRCGVSLDDAPLGEDGLSLHARLGDESSEFVGQISDRQDSVVLDYTMQCCLTGREIYIVNQRFGRFDDTPKTSQWIGDTLGISRERVRQLEIAALKKLRAELEDSQEGFALALALQRG